MKIEKIYDARKESGKVYFSFRIIIKDDNNRIKPIFISINETVINNPFCVKLSMMCNEEFLRKHKIEYIIEDDRLNNTRNIIPIGIVDFCYAEDNYFDSMIFIADYEDNLYEMNQIINNIENAIKIKYEGYKFIEKCKKNITETIELD